MTCDESWLLLGADFLSEQVRIISEHLRGARRARQNEPVHQARVASRRFRAALEMFGDCFPAEQARPWRKSMRRLRRSLGPARDTDVQIESVAAAQKALAAPRDKSLHPGVQRLLLRLRQRRKAFQQDVILAIDRLERARVLSEIAAATEHACQTLRSRGVVIQAPAAFLRAEREILRRVEELLAWQDCLADEKAKDSHHQMRIAAKRLRYTVEISQPLYDGAMAAPVEAVKELQTLLGDIHDCDVWDEQLDSFEEEERERARAFYGRAAPFSRLRPGIRHFQQLRRCQRQQRFGELITLWARLRHEGFWDRLAGMLVSRLQTREISRDEGDERDKKE
jgi:CHAD domain-containing protein